MSEVSDNQAYCRDVVKDGAPERFMVALFEQKHHQRVIFALLAFNLELAKTRDVVSEPMLGEIRLQWWQEAVEGIIEGNVRKHPIVEELAEAIEQINVSILYELINLRRVELTSVGGENIKDIIAHAEKLGRTLHLLLVTAVNDEVPETVEEDIKDISAAWSLAGLVRVIQNEDFNASTKEEALATILPMAEGYMEKVKIRTKKAPKAFLPAYLYYWMARSELKSIARGNTEPLTKLRLMAIVLWRSVFPTL